MESSAWLTAILGRNSYLPRATPCSPWYSKLGTGDTVTSVPDLPDKTFRKIPHFSCIILNFS